MTQCTYVKHTPLLIDANMHDCIVHREIWTLLHSLRMPQAWCNFASADKETEVQQLLQIAVSQIKKLACWLQLLSRYSYLSVLLRTFTLPWGNEAGMSHIGHLEPKSLWKSRFSEHSITNLTSNLFRTFASNHTFLSIPIRLALYFSLVKIFVTFYSQGEQQVVWC